MARYIDADKFLKKNEPPMCSDDLYEALHEEPAADVVEIPCRCRDCKHRRETMHGSYCLPAFGLKRITDLDAFCSYGERRTDNDL